MKIIFMLSILFLLFCHPVGVAMCDDNLVADNEIHHRTDIDHTRSIGFLDRITLMQYKLKQKMSGLVRDVKNKGGFAPLVILAGVAFAYGAFHAAGPGHGKLIAISYVMSHRCSMAGGLIIGLLIALVHGASGVIGVLGLRYIIQSSFNESLTTVTTVTQSVSLGILAFLGLGTLIQHMRAAFFNSKSKSDPLSEKAASKGILPWILAAGLVPCPAVVMVMLFCLSMDETALGLILTICVQLGMAVTISAVVTAAVMGKASTFRVVPSAKVGKLEAYVGMGSGAVAMVIGVLFLVTTVFATQH